MRTIKDKVFGPKIVVDDSWTIQQVKFDDGETRWGIWKGRAYQGSECSEAEARQAIREAPELDKHLTDTLNNPMMPFKPSPELMEGRRAMMQDIIVDAWAKHNGLVHTDEGAGFIPSVPDAFSAGFKEGVLYAERRLMDPSAYRKPAPLLPPDPKNGKSKGKQGNYDDLYSEEVKALMKEGSSAPAQPRATRKVAPLLPADPKPGKSKSQ